MAEYDEEEASMDFFSAGEALGRVLPGVLQALFEGDTDGAIKLVEEQRGLAARAGNAGFLEGIARGLEYTKEKRRD
jgi:hypothetical protein